MGTCSYRCRCATKPLVEGLVLKCAVSTRKSNLLRKPLVEGLVLKYQICKLVREQREAPRGGAGIEIADSAIARRHTCEAPRGGAGIEIMDPDVAPGRCAEAPRGGAGIEMDQHPS